MAKKSTKKKFRVLTVRDIVRAMNNLDRRIRKLERRERTVLGFSTDVIGQEMPAPKENADDWPDDDFFYVDGRTRNRTISSFVAQSPRVVGFR